MLTSLRMAKRALREGHSIHALLELNAIIEEQPENWLAYCLRARVNAALERYLEAISDCTHVLQQPKSVNRRNRIQLLERISSYADKLCRIQKAQLDRTFRKDFGVSSQKTVAGLPSTGRIGQIGKFILDPNDIAKISHLVLDKVTAQSTVRRLTQEAAESLNKLLRQIGEQPGVLGSCVICRDGFLYVSTFPNSFDLDSLGICSLGAYINAINIGKKIGYHPVKQIILRNGKSLVLILDIGLGLLVTVAGNLNRSELVGLVEAINEITSTK